jgi:D-aminopeptidase
VPKRAQRLVAVLYEHALLGEGIARILLLETRAEVAVAPAGDRYAVASVLARQPSVVVFEGDRCEPDCRRLVPHAVLIDVTSAMGARTGASTATTDLEKVILAAVRGADAPPGGTGCPPSRRR